MNAAKLSMVDEPSDQDLTRLLNDWVDGDVEARNDLARRVLPDLKRLASRRLALERNHHTLQPTALVNEAFSQLIRQKKLNFEHRGQFFAFVGDLMRRVLVDHARAHKASKRGSGQTPEPLEAALGYAAERSDELIRLDRCLRDLARFNPLGAKVVELQFFVGLTHQEIAEALDISRARARRLWTESRAWLYVQMTPDEKK